MEPKKTIVISAVNIVVGGTLTILRDCLEYLSSIAQEQNLRIVALVHDKELASYPNIEYIELPWAKTAWVKRLWCEYVTMKKISRQLSPVYLWLSLHDTTPNVIALRRAVYCHNPFPFYKATWRDLKFNYKIYLFSLFSKYIYKTNIKKNDFVVVQQNWFKDEFIRMFDLAADKLIVAYPAQNEKMPISRAEVRSDKVFKFLFPSSANSYKNFELLCQAAKNIEEQGIKDFKVYITLSGDENKYAAWLRRKYGNVSAIEFAGFQSREGLFDLYSQVDCLVFPAKGETWGLPISEFAVSGKPILAADLPYAHTTAIGSQATAFFNPYKVNQLQKQMKKLIKGEEDFLAPVPSVAVSGSHTYSWEELFTVLLRG